MIYNDLKGKKLSALGFGSMRLPVINGKFDDIDKKATADMVKIAIENGVNYFDTAWGYHGGMSEPVMGEILSKYPRDSYYLATKFPGYDTSNMGKVKEIFEAQLERLQTDYFDFYLFHNVCERNIDLYLDPSFGIRDYLVEQRAAGRIKHLGFSAHASLENIKRFLDAYGDDMEFCQLQVNYLDWDFQKAREKVALMKEWGLPVIIMEPIRGGKLANVPEEFLPDFKKIREDETPVALAFRFVQDIPEAVVTLSGMSDMTQLKENLETFREPRPLTREESDALRAIAEKMVSRTSLPCTSCRYCTDHCPMELDIPMLIEMYNEFKFTGGGFIAPMVIGSLPEEKRPSSCIGCRACEAVCPQEIKVSEMMSNLAASLKK